MPPKILDSLTPAQQAAVTQVEGPLLILAGPGSGKTRVVTHRIAYMVEQGVYPGRILALTFTNKAADEMRERVSALVPGANVWLGTFHRFCSRLLRRYADHAGLQANFTIYDTSDSMAALKRVLKTADIELRMTTPDRVARRISWLKNHLVTSEDYESRDGDELASILEAVYPAYQRELLQANAVDFDDLLLHVVSLLRQSPELRASLDETYQYVMVDEYQDTNLAQYAIVRGLSNTYPNLAVTGDPDQSIYGWRGANLNNILDFENDYPNVRVVKLEQNYRSTPNILRVASALISNNTRRKAKDLFTENAEGQPVRLATYRTHTEEADQIVAEISTAVSQGKARPRDFAVFYRVNALSRTFEHALRSVAIPYQIVNGVEFYQRREIKDVLAYLRLIHNPADNTSLARIINVPRRQIGRTTLDRLAAFASQQGIPMLEAARLGDKVTGISKAIGTRLARFAELIDRLNSGHLGSVEEVLGLIVSETGYLAELRSSSLPEDVERAANVEELLAAAREFDAENQEDDAVGSFLERASLVNDVDAWDDQTDRVTLMTLHAAKGLEFPYVYVIGVEQGLIPHERSINIPEQEEEERRLLFVGITRAQRELQLSYVDIRARRGGLSHTIPSPFLMELPRHEMAMVGETSRRAVREPMWDDCFDHEHNHHHDDDHAHNHVHDPLAGEPPTLSRVPAPRGLPADVPTPLPSAPLQTAAQMMDSVDAADDTDSRDAPVDPNTFEIGMTVIHPTYGPGKIAALSGQGRNRTGTINFPTAGQKKFVLSASPLRPR